MNENTVSHEHMLALKALSDTNLKVSEARALLTELEETETKYLVEREEKAMARITALLEESKNVLDETAGNYDEVQKFFVDISVFADFLKESHETFQSVLNLFEENKVAWEADMAAQEVKVADLRQMAVVDRVKVENERKSIESSRKQLDNDQRKLVIDREALVRAINRLKANRI